MVHLTYSLCKFIKKLSSLDLWCEVIVVTLIFLFSFTLLCFCEEGLVKKDECQTLNLSNLKNENKSRWNIYYVNSSYKSYIYGFATHFNKINNLFYLVEEI